MNPEKEHFDQAKLHLFEHLDSKIGAKHKYTLNNTSHVDGHGFVFEVHFTSDSIPVSTINNDEFDVRSVNRVDELKESRMSALIKLDENVVEEALRRLHTL